MVIYLLYIGENDDVNDVSIIFSVMWEGGLPFLFVCFCFVYSTTNNSAFEKLLV